MTIDNLTFGELKQIAAMFGAGAIAPCAKPRDDHGMAMVIADRGHVWVGKVTTDADWAHIEGGRIIRLWGTTKGLNELVKGPLSGTKVDSPADLKVSRKAIIAIVPVEAEKWSV